jgi:hypothetical protein
VPERTASLRLVLAAGLLLAGIAGPIAAPCAMGAPAKAPAKPGQPASTLELVYGDDHAFGVITPPGWVLDDTSGLGSRIRVVFYPKGQTWATSPVVMYSNPLHQDPKHPKTLLEMIERDVAEFEAHAPKGRVTTAPNLSAGGGRPALVRYFAPEGGAPTSAVSYLQEPDFVMMLVLDAKSPGEFTRALPAYREMVGSYQFVAAGVNTPTRPGQRRK